ncbi:MAG: hypothetical protein R6U50_02065 [Desulfobacterales bacterium]
MKFFGSERSLLSAAVFFTCFGLLFPQVGFAAWSSEPIAVSTELGQQCRPQVVYDESGGYYVVWQDFEAESVFAQHYNAAGDPMWNDPVQVGSGTCNFGQQSVPDGSGGLLVAYYDCSYIRVQRINSDGSLAWAEGGAAAINDDRPWITPDGTGGAIVMTYDGYVNRVAADGTLPWADADSPLVFGTNTWATKIVPDDQGGAILLWMTSADSIDSILLNRIDSSGEFYGEPLVLDSENFVVDDIYLYCPRLIPSDEGVIAAWFQYDDNNGLTTIEARRINDQGEFVWGEAKEILTGSPNNLWPLGLAPDGSGGTFIAWGEYIDETNSIVSAQYVDVNGSLVWENPVSLTSGDFDDMARRPYNTVPDGQGGFITAWTDINDQIKAQKVDATGAVLWGTDGTVLAAGNNIIRDPQLTTNGQGGAVAVWVDMASEPMILVAESKEYDVFMQGVNAEGVAGDPGYDPGDSSSNSNWPHCFISGIFGN